MRIEAVEEDCASIAVAVFNSGAPAPRGVYEHQTDQANALAFDVATLRYSERTSR